MKKELFYKISALVSANRPIYKITETDTIICHTYKGKVHRRFEEMKNLIEKNGWGQNWIPEHTVGYGYASSKSTSIVKSYDTVLYNKVKDKVSVSEFEVGYGWNYPSNRVYPLNRRTPILCVSDKLYGFFTFGRSKKKKVMPVLGSHMQSFNSLYRDVASMMYDLEHCNDEIFDADDPHYLLPLPIALYDGVKSQWEVIEKRMKIKIPKALRQFNECDVLTLLKALRNHNELSTVCMQIAKSEAEANANGQVVSSYGPMKREAFWGLLSVIMLGTDKYSWLIRDWIKDHVKLKKKMSLTVRSKTRIEDEHRKMSRKINATQIKEIKVHKAYTKMFKKFPIEGAELITTRQRLNRESEINDHCVAGYGGQINNGSCCIISIPYNGKHWTLQVCKVSYGKDQHDFRNAQFRGFRNEDAPAELNQKVNEFFTSIRTSHIKNVEAVRDELPF